MLSNCADNKVSFKVDTTKQTIQTTRQNSKQKLTEQISKVEIFVFSQLITRSILREERLRDIAKIVALNKK